MKLQHPVWCDPTFCKGPAEQPTDCDSRNGYQHHSCPMELNPLASFSFDFQALGSVVDLLGPEGFERIGAFAWLTASIAPWTCRTYLRIGLYGPDTAPRALFSLEMDPRHRLSPDTAMSGGERLPHLCEHALSETVSEAGERIAKRGGRS